MKLFICPNHHTPRQAEMARHVAGALERGLEAACAFSPEDSALIFGHGGYAAFEPEDSDYIVSVGGDGAVLRAAQVALAADKPLLGVNGGRLGYLCALDLTDVESFTPEALESLPVERRTLLSFQYGGRQRLALNDVVISKDDFGATVDLLVRCGGETISIRGDGVILATPTGSTAYNLSAGGPILMPDAACFALTPVCAHFSQRCARVLSDSAEVVFSPNHPDAGASVYADGARLGSLDEPLAVRRGEKRLALLSPRGNRRLSSVF